MARVGLPEFMPQSRAIHISSINAGLMRAKYGVLSLCEWLGHFDLPMWEHAQNTLTRDMSSCIMHLRAALDALVLVEHPGPPDARISFTRMSFDDPEMRALQDLIKGLRCECPRPGPRPGTVPGETRYIDFMGLTDFWMVCPPTRLCERMFPNGHRDIAIDLTLDFDDRTTSSGPLLRDLLVPAFDAAAELVRLVAKTSRDFGPYFSPVGPIGVV